MRNEIKDLRLLYPVKIRTKDLKMLILLTLRTLPIIRIFCTSKTLPSIVYYLRGDM